MDLKKIPQKWFLVLLLILAVLGSALGFYLFPEQNVSREENEKKPAEENVQEKTVISEEKLNKIINSLSLEQKVGQLFLLGFHSQKPSSEWLEFVRENNIGGIFFNSLSLSSLDELRALTAQNQGMDARGIPYFFAVSQEGGGQEAFSEGVTFFPSNMALAAAKDEKIAYEAGHITGRELKALGINLNLGPVLDILSDKEKSFIGSRAFADNPAAVALFGMRYLAGLQNTGIAGAVKYFPGLGGTSTNPEYAVPVITAKKEELLNHALQPFAEAVKQKAAAVVVGHGLYVQIDPRYPASLSDKVIRGLLRSSSGFNYHGLVITDDLSKKAVADNPGVAPSAVQAIKAGADIIFIRSGFSAEKSAYQAVIKAVRNGEISEEQINTSLKRILQAKFKYCLLNKEKQNFLWEKVGSTPSRQKAEEIAELSVTLVKKSEGLLPLKKEDKILVLTPDELPSAHMPSYLAELLEKDYPNLSYKQFTNYHEEEEKKEIRTLAGASDVIVVMTFNAGPNQASLVKDLLALENKQVIAAAVGNPFDLVLFPDVPTYFAVYSACPASLKVLADILSGEKTAKGELPVAMEVQKLTD